MPDYQKGKIYKITSSQTDEIYIGSTCEPYLSRRMVHHRSDYKAWAAGGRTYVSSFEIIQHPDAEIILIEVFPCSSIEELYAREQHHISENATIAVNKRRAHLDAETKKAEKARTDREYYETHREELRDYNQNYYDQNKEQIKDRVREWGAANREFKRAKANEKFVCECGTPYTCANRSRHRKTQFHQKWLASQPQ